jgi:predicted nucleotidyltransferase
MLRPAVYLFGSVAWPERFHADSDLDLAVEGLPDEKYLRALAELWRLLPAGRELNLVPLQAAFPELAERVRREGNGDFFLKQLTPCSAI